MSATSFQIIDNGLNDNRRPRGEVFARKSSRVTGGPIHFRAFRQSTGDDSGYEGRSAQPALHAAKNRTMKNYETQSTEDEASSSFTVSMGVQQLEIGCVVFP